MNNEILSAITPWANNIAYLVLWVFGTIIISRLFSRIGFKILEYFKYEKASITSEILEYGIYVISLAIVLMFAGVFTFSLIIVSILIVVLLIISLFNFIFFTTRNIKYYGLLKKKRLDKKYDLGRLQTVQKLQNKAKIIYPNKYLFQHFNR